MKKVWIVLAVLGVLAVAAGFTGIAYAKNEGFPVWRGMMSGLNQDGTPDGYGPGMMGRGGRGGMMGGYNQEGTPGGYGPGMMGRGGDGTYGPMHTYMIAALADGLDLTVEDLQSRIDGGETPYQVAQSAGLSDEDITTLFTEAHATALQQAVADGAITQEQADWMSQHMGQRGYGMMGGQGQGYGPCHGTGQ